MRVVLVFCLFLVGCAVPAPKPSDTLLRLDGAWRADSGEQIVFDIDQNRVMLGGNDRVLLIDRVEGRTVYFTGDEQLTVRLLGDNAAEWDTKSDDPIMLTRVE